MCSSRVVVSVEKERLARVNVHAAGGGDGARAAAEAAAGEVARVGCAHVASRADVQPSAQRESACRVSSEIKEQVNKWQVGVREAAAARLRPATGGGCCSRDQVAMGEERGETG